MLLEGKNAVARAFASEGARVFLAGRTIITLDEVAEDIGSSTRGDGGLSKAEVFAWAGDDPG